MATFKPVVFTTAKQIKSDGTTNIKIRIYHNKESQYLTTEYYIRPEWIDKNGEINEQCPGYDSFNIALVDIIQNYRRLLVKLGPGVTYKKSCIELRDYLEAATRSDYECIDFVAFSNTVISKISKPKTASWYDNALQSLIWFFGKEKIDIKEITAARLKLYIEKLTEKGPAGKPLEARSIVNYLEALRSLFKSAMEEYNDEDLDIIRIAHYPFAKVKMPKFKRKRKNVGIDEIKKIRDHKPKTEREEIARDVFMMMFYLMGININDLYQLEPPVAGRINYERSKTDTDNNVNNFVLSIKIEPELLTLLDKYSPDGFLSGIKARYNCSYNLMKSVNKGLKIISDEYGLSKVTTNWARHSWASIARNKALINKADVDFCLGHVNHEYKMADFYIEIDYSIYDRENRKVLDLLIDKPEEKPKDKPRRKKIEEIGSKNTYLRIVV
jgi:hypothetical protein